jgi:hypothetical protein
LTPPWTAKTIAEVHSAKAKMGITDVIEEFMKGKEDKVELPQDYLLSPTMDPSAANNQVDSPRETFSKSDSDATVVVANKHAWVLPNESGELVPLSVESSPSDDELKSEVDQSKNALELDSIKRLIDSFASGKQGIDLDPTAVNEKFDPHFDVEYSKGFDAANVDSNVDLSVIGKRLEIQTSASVAAEAVLHASSERFANIIHGEKQIMLVLPSRVSNSRCATPAVSISNLTYSKTLPQLRTHASWAPPSSCPRLWPSRLGLRVKLSVSKRQPV